MGTWGTGIYGNDTAEDVRELCNEIFPLVSVEEGNRIVFREFKDILEDDLIDDDYASFWYSLADWQWKHGILCEDIRMKTIQLLNDHAGIQDWEESARKSDVRKRKAVMDRLKFQLQNTMPPKKLPKAKLSKPKHKPGDIIIFRAKEKENDDELGWERSVGYIPFEYDSQYIRNSSLYYSEPISAWGKYLAVMCVGIERQLYSEYLTDFYNENSVYVFYDYCDIQKPTMKILSQCGFLPCITHYYDYEKQAIVNVVGAVA